MAEKSVKDVYNEHLRRERDQRGWSREYVAEKIGIADPKTVGRWERGVAFPSPYFRQKLCELFGKTAQELGLITENADKTISKNDTIVPEQESLIEQQSGNEIANEQGEENLDAHSETDLALQPQSTLSQEGMRTISRRTVLVGLACFVTGGVLGSGITWQILQRNQTEQTAAKWNSIANMLVARHSFRATTLQSGLVLIEGGSTADGLHTAASELFNLVTGTWSKTRGILNEERDEHTATLLSNGKVLVTGGFAHATKDSAELYDPDTEMWTLTKNSMSYSRTRHTATLLHNGKVLIAGGVDSKGLSMVSAELYDPVADTWSLAGTMLTPHADYIAVRMLDGRVLVAGGTLKNDGHTTTNHAEVYDPTTNAWTRIQSMHMSRAYFTAVLLPAGKVLVIGGRLSSYDSTPAAEIYDPLAEIWSLTASMQYPRQNPLGQGALLVENGTVLVVGGDDLGSSEIYSPTTETWTFPLRLDSPHYFGATALIGKGQVLVVGGYDVAYTGDNSHITASAASYIPKLA